MPDHGGFQERPSATPCGPRRTEAEDRLVLAGAHGSDTDLARALGRSVRSIGMRRHRLRRAGRLSEPPPAAPLAARIPAYLAARLGLRPPDGG